MSPKGRKAKIFGLLSDTLFATTKVTMYMAISADGFIASENDDTPWPAEATEQ